MTEPPNRLTPPFILRITWSIERSPFEGELRAVLVGADGSPLRYLTLTERTRQALRRRVLERQPRTLQFLRGIHRFQEARDAQITEHFRAAEGELLGVLRGADGVDGVLGRGTH